MQLKVINAFKWAHRGVEVEEFAEDQVIDTEDKDLIEVSLREGWTEAHAGDAGLTVAELKEKLDALKVEYPSSAKKADLLQILQEAEASA